MHEPLRVVQVNTKDDRGEEAVRVAWALHWAYRRSGVEARMAVGRKFSIDQDVFEIPNDEFKSRYAKALLDISCRTQLLNYHFRGMWRLSRIIKWLAEPRYYWNIRQGVEELHYPGTWHLLDLHTEKPDIMHCHNLWGYFDLRALLWLSQKLPVVLTLHDCWLLTGHCQDPLDCEGWKTGCGRCPYLGRIPYPIKKDTPIKKDATRYNWRQKQKILSGSRLYVASPSRWLMDKVKQSLLAEVMVESRVIPYGVDLSAFYPADKQVAKQKLKIKPSAKVILSTTIPAQKNIWEDYRTTRETLKELSTRLPEEEILVIAFLEPGPNEIELGASERFGKIEIHFLFYPKNPNIAAGYYQAADVYVHTASAANFPLAILEAIACGVPVIAASVGGIPEQIEDGINGFLTPREDISALTLCLRRLLTDENLCRRMSKEALEIAAAKFSLQREAEDYLNWYEELKDRA